MKKRIAPLMLSVLLVIGLLTVNAAPIYALSDSDVSVSIGSQHSVALKADGTLWAWGWNGMGQLGDGTTTNRSKPVKVMSDVKAADAGDYFTAAVKKDGTLWVWGDNSNGKSGAGSDANIISTPVQIMKDVAAVSACLELWVIKTDGNLYGLGYGAAEDGTIVKRGEPSDIQEVMPDVAMVSAGDTFVMAVKKDGTLWAWGANLEGQVGNGETSMDPVSKPFQVMTDVASVSAGADHTMALKTDGSVWTWGENGDGELGYKTDSFRSGTPAKVMTGVSAIHAGFGVSMALKTDGTLWAWGKNSVGQLGDGTTTNRFGPVKVMAGVAAMTSNGYTSMVVKSDGTLWSWGSNPFGIIGDGTENDRISPVKIMSGIMMNGKTAPAATTVTAPETKSVTAVPTKSKVYVNGLEKSFEAYSINGNNYFKLRDIAMVLNGTKKQFEVAYDKEKNAINMLSLTPYTVVGGEMILSGVTGNRQGTPTASKLYLDGKEISFTAYCIGGNNYFKLRDIGKAFDFGVTWDNNTKAISILTSSGYTE